MKMMQLTDAILNEHYAHLREKPFFQMLKDSMMATPVIACCLEGVEAVRVVRAMTGATNGRNADPGTIRGDYCVSNQQNIVHASDSLETAAVELARFFKPEEIFSYTPSNMNFMYALDASRLRLYRPLPLVWKTEYPMNRTPPFPSAWNSMAKSCAFS